MTMPELTCQLTMGNMEGLFQQIIDNAPHAKRLIQRDSHKGKTLVICGAGPSLAHHHDWLWKTPAHQVWGCNSALPYLRDQKLPVTHGFCVDQNPDMLNAEEWERTFPVTYLLATSVHPGLREHLEKAGRPIVWFHNYLGIPDPKDWTPPIEWKCETQRSYEMFLYTTKFGPCVQVGYGLNSVPRAVCLAIWMGFKKIHVVGADCAAAPEQDPMPALAVHPDDYTAWVQQVPLYASGRTVGQAYGDKAIMTEGIINGRRWATRTDMLISAVHLVDLKKNFPEQVNLVGDTLPNAMLTQGEDFFKTLPRMAGNGQVAGFHLHEALKDMDLTQLLDTAPTGAQ